MPAYDELTFSTSGEKFYDITESISKHLEEKYHGKSGVLYLFNPHTSCALTISESYDSSAKRDLERFLNHLAPRNLSFIEHISEGPDDSPSHMKSILLQQSLNLMIDSGKLCLGTWQGIYLAEFRDSVHNRKLWMKFIGQ